ncbi:hypothetical protein STFR1_10733 [Bacillus vallismortis]
MPILFLSYLKQDEKKQVNNGFWLDKKYILINNRYIIRIIIESKAAFKYI